MNAGRAFAFRRFLLDEFCRVKGPTSEAQRSFAPLKALDVAGGKGELSFELQNLNNWTCAVIDPRDALELDDFKKKWKFGIYVRNRHWRDFSQGWAEDKEPTDPDHFRVLFDKEIVEWVKEELNSRVGAKGDDIFQRNPIKEPPEWSALIKRAIETTYWRKGEWQADEANEGDIQKSTEPDPMDENPSYSRFMDYLLSCDIIVGMHPDRATEFIVDCALLLNKSFAIVPCCVFPKAFSERRLKCGKCTGNCEKCRGVVSYDDFIEYLLQKDDRIQKGELQFDGRNTVVYFNAGKVGGDNMDEGMREGGQWGQESRMSSDARPTTGVEDEHSNNDETNLKHASSSEMIPDSELVTTSYEARTPYWTACVTDKPSRGRGRRGEA